ncbi:cobalamin-binding protein [Segetibacter sp. 3557_3]|uniref:ABC transporter substrate-binding protein n=1 Tax=Segetibacter sp. 3557_3 TaxID=2547429 RepID=UPI0010589182|nr:helical backbone metal receptor [Segetibacter sp. 3557_3]TDH27418.1 cobalamin-binding protein [Segetibacter sp. 3557_3]
MLTITDQLSCQLELPEPARRIVSLVPSQTELLHDLGLESEVVGITKFCVHPEQWFHSKTRVGGTKKVHLDRVEDLQPDLVIGNKEENIKEEVEEIKKLAPVYISDVSTLEQAIDMITAVGAMTNTEHNAGELITAIKHGFNDLEQYVKNTAVKRIEPHLLSEHVPIRTAYLIWQEPLMAVGSNTFIDDMLQRCGLQNIFAAQERYPMITVDQLSKDKCDLVFLSTEPYPFSNEHVAELQAQLPGSTVMLVDGQMFSWYGSRLVKASTYFKSLLEQINTKPLN